MNLWRNGRRRRAGGAVRTAEPPSESLPGLRPAPAGDGATRRGQALPGQAEPRPDRDRVGRPAAPVPAPGGDRGYYGQPVLKEPVWTWEIPWYFFAGGMSGVSAPLAFAARLTGNHRLARAALTAGSVGLAVSPVLLVSDLGRPERFHHMLRVLRPTSPMSVGSWLLATLSPSLFAATAADRLGIAPRFGRVSEAAAALLGPALSTYTAVLVADTAVPVWHQAGRELPAVFAGSSAASAGAAACLLTPPEDAGPARRLAIGGAVTELAAVRVMEHRLGELAEPYRRPPAARLARLAKLFTAAGAVVLAAAGRRRPAAAAGSLLLLAGSACERQAVIAAGRLSARDPRYVVEPQRRRLAERGAEGGTGDDGPPQPTVVH